MKNFTVLGKIVLVGAIALLTIFAFVQTARAIAPSAAPVVAVQQEGPTPPAVGWADVYFVVATVAFFKVQFELQKKQIVGLAIGFCILVALGPRIEASVPVLAGWLFDIVAAFKLVMYACGGYDFATDIVPKLLSLNG